MSANLVPLCDKSNKTKIVGNQLPGYLLQQYVYSNSLLQYILQCYVKYLPV